MQAKQDAKAPIPAPVYHDLLGPKKTPVKAKRPIVGMSLLPKKTQPVIASATAAVTAAVVGVGVETRSKRAREDADDESSAKRPRLSATPVRIVDAAGNEPADRIPSGPDRAAARQPSKSVAPQASNTETVARRRAVSVAPTPARTPAPASAASKPSRAPRAQQPKAAASSAKPGEKPPQRKSTLAGRISGVRSGKDVRGRSPVRGRAADRHRSGTRGSPNRQMNGDINNHNAKSAGPVRRPVQQRRPALPIPKRQVENTGGRGRGGGTMNWGGYGGGKRAPIPRNDNRRGRSPTEMNERWRRLGGRSPDRRMGGGGGGGGGRDADQREVARQLDDMRHMLKSAINVFSNTISQFTHAVTACTNSITTTAQIQFSQTHSFAETSKEQIHALMIAQNQFLDASGAVDQNSTALAVQRGASRARSQSRKRKRENSHSQSRKHKRADSRAASCTQANLPRRLKRDSDQSSYSCTASSSSAAPVEVCTTYSVQYSCM